jgi:Na+-transporting methylmalonyl-CoA/oxaloacetate decarboxylase gamma subunit
MIVFVALVILAFVIHGVDKLFFESEQEENN